MTLWLNGKKDDAYVKLGGDLSGTIKIKAGLAIKGEKFVALLASLDECSDVKSMGENPQFESGMICMLKFNLEDWETEYQGNKKKQVATPKSKWIGEQLLELPERFSGLINLGTADETIETILSGKNKKGKDLSEETLTELKESVIDCTEFVPMGDDDAEALKKLDAIDTKSLGITGKGGFRTNAAQTELSKIHDRFHGLCTLLSIDPKDATLLTVTEAIQGIKDEEYQLTLKLLVSTVIGGK